MALRPDFIDAHIMEWELRLHSVYRPYRDKWPSRLFHHAPLENAALMLKDGNLRSRNDPSNRKTVDVAAAGVIDNRSVAHNYSRLYFRPRTPTQWHIEGIRKPGECSYGDSSHAPILVMFIFDARSILTTPGVRFSDRNMQLNYATTGDTEEFFSSIPFDKVFHEGATSDRSTIDARCAEVLAPSPMKLAGALQWIYCRSAAERDTLLHFLGDHADRWRGRIQISDDLLVFEKKYVFVEEVSIDQDGVVGAFNPRRDRQKIHVAVQALASDGKLAIDFLNSSMEARPPAPSSRWRFPQKLRKGTYLITIRIEGHLAYQSFMTIGADNLI